MENADELTTDPPRVGEQDASRIAAEIFGVEGEVAPLVSERDRNFRVRTPSGEAFVLKFANPAEDAGILDMQAEAMRHVATADPSLPVPRVRPTLGGQLHDQIDSPEDGRASLVRMLTYVEGETPDPVELTLDALISFGRTNARMGLALRGFFHPSSGRALLWDLRRAPELIPLTEHAIDPGRGAMARRMLEHYRDEVSPRLPALRAQVIHNDMYLANLLVDPADPSSITGIIDFGDMLHTVLLEDLAVLVADLMLDRDDPFASALAATRGYESVTPLEPVEREVLIEFVLARVLATAVIAEWRLGLDPENRDYILAGVEQSWTLLERLDDLGPDEVRRRFAADDDTVSGAGVAPSALAERRRRVMSSVSPLSYEEPLHLVRGDGVWMFDPAGTAYLDAYNNVPVAGHANPRIAEAMARQARTLITNTRYLHETVVEVSERLVATMPAGSGLDTVLWVNSGSEANEAAMRLARAATGGHEGAIVTEFAYHGVTMLGADLSPEEWPQGEHPARMATIPAPDAYRGRYRGDTEPQWAEHSAAHADEAIADLRSRSQEPALVYIDGGFVSDGVFVPPPAFHAGLVERVRAAGGYYVADEVQAGFGRSGTGLWSFETYGVAPDFVTLGKPMGNGFPVAALVTRREFVDAFGERVPEFFSTFGGNTLSAAVALANLTLVQEEGLQQSAADVGAYMGGLLRTLAEDHEVIGDVRGTGLMLGVELVTDRDGERVPAGERTDRVVNAMRRRRVLVGSTGPGENVLKIRPPLVFSRENADMLVSVLDESLRETAEP